MGWGGPHTSVSFTFKGSTRFSQWISEKSPLMLPAMGRKSSHFEIRQRVLFWTRSALRETIEPEPNLSAFYRSLTDLGEEKYSTPAHSSQLVPHNWEEGIWGQSWEALVKFIIQKHRLIKRLKLIMRLEHFPCTHTLSPHYWSPTYSSSFYPIHHDQLSREKSQSILKSKNTVWGNRANIRTRQGYDRICQPGNLKQQWIIF